MEKIKILFCLLLGIFVLGCTQQERAKGWGGEATITLPKDRKLLIATWKDNNLWYLTRPMKAGEEPETYELRENSPFGVIEGKVILKEQQ
ncbi:MAG: hypothetical protein Q8R26_03965 [bacterium]|nr:hypothetical protein [bacterium]